MARPATGETPKRNVRVPKELWDAAMAEAKIEGRTITDVINTDLHRYVTRRRREREALGGAQAEAQPSAGELDNHPK